jgi:hypothetical protein
LYERYIHVSLNQVVIEDQQPDKNAKNIVIKSKIVTMGYLFDLICDTFWAAVHPSDFILVDISCKRHCIDHSSYLQQEFSLDEFDGFKEKFIHATKKVDLYFKKLNHLFTSQLSYI